jgi:L-alanine-DL-glutamate epimerase-like enolase superfamily enzyme
MDAADGASLKLIKFGGIKALLLAVDYMKEQNMHVNISGKAGDSSVSAATIGHISHVASKLDWYSNVSIQYLADDIIKNPMTIQDGKIILRSGPGLGIEIDENKVEKYKL